MRQGAAAISGAAAVVLNFRVIEGSVWVCMMSAPRRVHLPDLPAGPVRFNPVRFNPIHYRGQEHPLHDR